MPFCASTVRDNREDKIMIKKSVRTAAFIGLVLLALLLAGCPSPLDYTGGTAGAESQPAVEIDETLGVAVFTDEDGSRTRITSQEGDESVDCVEVSDFVVAGGSAALHSSGSGRGPRAVVIGKRGDGRPGVWLVYPGGIVVVPEGDDGDVTSELLEAASDADGFRWDDGWSYDAAAISDDFRIIVGVAENPEAEWLAEYLGTTPKVVVWWNLYERDGKYHLSRAHVVAEYPEWSFEEAHHGGRGHRHQMQHWLRWFFDHLGLWFFAWADDYMGDLAGEDVLGGDKPVETVGDGTYGIFGYDKDGDYARASITPFKVLDIEKTDLPEDPGDPGENKAPWPVTGPTGISLLSEGNQSLTLELRDGDGNLITDPADFDPDQDPVTFEVVLVSIDNPAFAPLVEVSPAGVFQITVWEPEYSGSYVNATYQISTTDGDLTTAPEANITVMLY